MSNLDLKLAELEGNQKADFEAMGQCFKQIKALYDYLGLTYIHLNNTTIKIKKEK